MEKKVLNSKGKNSGCIAIVVIIAFIGLFTWWCSSGDEANNKNLTQAQKDSINHVEWIKNQFDPWDGSHIKVVEYTKSTMNDPESFKHVSTRYFDLKKSLKIVMTFRGKNMYGGVVTNTIEAFTDSLGNITSYNNYDMLE